MAEFCMPSLGADMSAGTLVAFRKRPGEPIRRGEILAEVETDKGLIEIECFAEGVLERVLVEPGTKVEVGAPLALIAEGSTARPAAPPQAAPTAVTVPPAEMSAREPPGAAQAVPAHRAEADRRELEEPVHATPAARRILRQQGLDPAHIHAADPHGTLTGHDLQATPTAIPVARPPEGARPSSRIAVSPRARALAQSHGIDVSGLTGSGPSGSVIAADVQRSLAAPAPESADARMRRAIAEATSRSKREIPHFYLSQTVDLERPLAWLQERNAGRAVDARVLPIALFVRAVTRGLRKVPELNGWYVDDRFRTSAEVALTLAVSLRGGGLVAPTLQSPERLSLDQLSRAIEDVVESARNGRLRSSQMVPGTIGITSLGERGVESVVPVIMPPQVAMVGFGAIQPAACVVDGAVAARRAVVVTLAADHRVCDGHRGGLFLRAVMQVLQEVPDE